MYDKKNSRSDHIHFVIEVSPVINIPLAQFTSSESITIRSVLHDEIVNAKIIFACSKAIIFPNLFL